MTLGQALDRAAGEAPDQEAYIYRGRRLRYAEWNERSRRVAANLVERGAVKGDRVALLLPPRPEYPIAYLAAAQAGLVTVGINPRLAEPEIAYVLRDAGARYVVAIDRFAGREYARNVESLRAELPELEAVFVVEEGEIGWEASNDRGRFRALFGQPGMAALDRLAEIERSPLLGEHTEEILREVLGYSDAEVGTLKEAGAFSKEPPKVKEYHALREAG